jgi:hypothetical protein
MTGRRGGTRRGSALLADTPPSGSGALPAAAAAAVASFAARLERFFREPLPAATSGQLTSATSSHSANKCARIMWTRPTAACWRRRSAQRRAQRAGGDRAMAGCGCGGAQEAEKRGATSRPVFHDAASLAPVRRNDRISGECGSPQQVSRPRPARRPRRRRGAYILQQQRRTQRTTVAQQAAAACAMQHAQHRVATPLMRRIAKF